MDTEKVEKSTPGGSEWTEEEEEEKDEDAEAYYMEYDEYDLGQERGRRHRKPRRAKEKESGEGGKRELVGSKSMWQRYEAAAKVIEARTGWICRLRLEDEGGEANLRLAKHISLSDYYAPSDITWRMVRLTEEECSRIKHKQRRYMHYEHGEYDYHFTRNSYLCLLTVTPSITVGIAAEESGLRVLLHEPRGDARLFSFSQTKHRTKGKFGEYYEGNIACVATGVEARREFNRYGDGEVILRLHPGGARAWPK